VKGPTGFIITPGSGPAATQEAPKPTQPAAQPKTDTPNPSGSGEVKNPNQ